MAHQRPANMLALAVLALLNERPMHPYEMSTTMRERHKENSIKLTYGSLYTVVESLARGGYIRARETVREGRRPERTIYEITTAGRTELYDWMSELVSTPAKEYLRFEAALSMLAVLTPEDAVRLLTERRSRLMLQIEHARAGQALTVREGLPRLFMLETGFVSALAQAELRYVDELIKMISERTLDGIHIWDAIHTRETEPDRIRDVVVRALRAGGHTGSAADAVLNTTERAIAAQAGPAGASPWPAWEQPAPPAPSAAPGDAAGTPGPHDRSRRPIT
ncbi:MULTISPECIES: PadR family transcriptional regulator [unclassified Frankia]|nr:MULTISPECIES: PadR family transcriptional regulator [unclassified Frankia]